MKKDFGPDLDRLRRELRAYIQKTGKDDRELAEEVGIKANTLSSFLTGTTKIPRLDFILALIQNTDFKPSALGLTPRKAGEQYIQGLPREVRDAVQKAVQMVEDFISVIPAGKRVEDKAKKGLYVMLVADLLVAGRQEEIPDTMKGLIQDFSRPPELA
jgi:transcriptional regulator with XRE-family HTH domain